MPCRVSYGAPCGSSGTCPVETRGSGDPRNCNGPSVAAIGGLLRESQGIPPLHVYLLDAKPGSDMTRAEWESKARPAIRAWLAANGLESKVRCLVTSWDVPLRIGRRPADSPIVTARKTLLAEARKAADATLAELPRSSMAWRPKKSGQTGRLLRKKLRRSSARSWTPPLGRRRSGSGQWGGAWRRNGRKRRSRRFS